MNLKTPLVILLLAGVFYWYLAPISLSEKDYNKHIKDKVVLICGASSGIGEELAYNLARKGAKLLLVARTESKLLKVQEKALKHGSPKVEILPYDFNNVTGSSKVVDRTIELFGQLDFLVLNHAAMTTGYILHFTKHQDPEFISRLFRINLLSHIELALKAMPYLEKSAGHIFVTSSIGGEMAAATVPIYASTKHAMNGFFYSLQQELLVKKSPVGISIGALGPIGTEAMLSLTKDTAIKKSLIGDLAECVTGVVDSMITRPKTYSYPKILNFIMRMFWYTNMNTSTLNKDDYETTIKKLERGHENAKERGFQVGNN